MANPHLDTASQRPPTGLNPEARELIVRIPIHSPGAIIRVLFLDLYASFDDYYAAVDAVWGLVAADLCRFSVRRYTEEALARRGPVTGTDWTTNDLASLGLLRAPLCTAWPRSDPPPLSVSR